LIIIFVSPFYFKNYYLYKKFAISLTPFEHLSQKIDFIKEMKNGQHKGIKNFVFDQQMRDKGPDRGRLINSWYLPKTSLQKIWDLKLFNTHSMIHSFPTPPKEKSDAFFRELDKRHLAALQRNYGKSYNQIDILSKDDLFI
jgi:hypothetical protein